jgi:hypothetical protein
MIDRRNNSGLPHERIDKPRVSRNSCIMMNVWHDRLPYNSPIVLRHLVQTVQNALFFFM